MIVMQPRMKTISKTASTIIIALLAFSFENSNAQTPKPTFTLDHQATIQYDEETGAKILPSSQIRRVMSNGRSVELYFENPIFIRVNPHTYQFIRKIRIRTSNLLEAQFIVEKSADDYLNPHTHDPPF